MRPPYSAIGTGAMSSTMTGGYVQQVPYAEGGSQTQHSQLGMKTFLLLVSQLHLYSAYTLYTEP